MLKSIRILARDLKSQIVQSIGDLKLPKDDVTFELKGYKLRAFSPRANKISRHIYLHGIWEPEVTTFVESVIKPGDCVWDIGADVGYYALLFSSLVGPGGKVVAFEPIPKAREKLKENIALNGRGNIQVEERALGRAPGKFILEKPLEVSRVNLTKKQLDKGDIEIQIVRGDDIAQEYPRPDCIKMDVEGAEFEILQGMEQLLLKCSPKFILELHGPYLPQFGTTGEAVVNWLQAKGYTLEVLDQPVKEWNERNTTVYAHKT